MLQKLPPGASPDAAIAQVLAEQRSDQRLARDILGESLAQFEDPPAALAFGAGVGVGFVKNTAEGVVSLFDYVVRDAGGSLLYGLNEVTFIHAIFGRENDPYRQSYIDFSTTNQVGFDLGRRVLTDLPRLADDVVKAFDDATERSNAKDTPFGRGSTNPTGQFILNAATLPLVATKVGALADLGKAGELVNVGKAGELANVGKAGNAVRAAEELAEAPPKVPSTVVRQDNNFPSPVNERGNPKARLDDNGDLVPPNPKGTGDVKDQVRGGNSDKSPYISTTDPTQPGANPRQYGNQEITIDTKRLQAEIEAGTVKDVTIIPPKQVREVLEGRLEAAQRRVDANRTPKNVDRLKRAQDDLSNAVADGECLIKGCVPSRFISPVRPATPRPGTVTPPQTAPQLPKAPPPANPSNAIPAIIGGAVTAPLILNNAVSQPAQPPAPPPAPPADNKAN